MTADGIASIGKYLIALLALGGCFWLIQTSGGTDMSQAWTVIGLIVGWIVRDSAGSSATTNAVRTIAATNGTPAV